MKKVRENFYFLKYNSVFFFYTIHSFPDYFHSLVYAAIITGRPCSPGPWLCQQRLISKQTNSAVHMMLNVAVNNTQAFYINSMFK